MIEPYRFPLAMKRWRLQDKDLSLHCRNRAQVLDQPAAGTVFDSGVIPQEPLALHYAGDSADSLFACLALNKIASTEFSRAGSRRLWMAASQRDRELRNTADALSPAPPYSVQKDRRKCVLHGSSCGPTVVHWHPFSQHRNQCN